MFQVGFGLGLPYRDAAHTLLVTRILIDSLTAIDRAWLLFNPHTPALYSREAGMRYVNDPPGVENWREIGQALPLREGDCKVFTAWRAAEYQLQGVAARPAFGWRMVPAPEGHPQVSAGTPMLLIHFFVRLPNGRVEDPSRVLGMPVNDEAGYRVLVRAA